MSVPLQGTERAGVVQPGWMPGNTIVYGALPLCLTGDGPAEVLKVSVAAGSPLEISGFSVSTRPSGIGASEASLEELGLERDAGHVATRCSDRTSDDAADPGVQDLHLEYRVPERSGTSDHVKVRYRTAHSERTATIRWSVTICVLDDDGGPEQCADQFSDRADPRVVDARRCRAGIDQACTDYEHDRLTRVQEQFGGG